jgi:hypothetical protein
VPPRDTIAASTASALRQGVRLELLGVAGAGKVTWPDRLTPQRARTPMLRVRASSLATGQRVTLRVVDDQGRAVVSASALDGWGYTRRDRSFDVRLPTDAKKLDLTFAVHRSRFVEFVAKPSRP